MARYRRRRFYRRKTGKWAANIQEVANTITPTQGTWSATETIMSNPTQQPTYVSQTFTVKNIEINFNLDYEGSSSDFINLYEGITAYIMFVPQGMNVTSDYNVQHPEYIMAMKYIGSPTAENVYIPGTGQYNSPGQQYQPTKIRTRLARKLQSGDSVVLFVKGIQTGSTESGQILRLSGVIRWWTKAN